ncbi:MAG: hypothetical protein ABL961_00225 [Vicinamibacterales bacterium]
MIGAIRRSARTLDGVCALLLCEGLAVGLWLLPASAHIVQWPASGPVRLALLAPLWQLKIAVTVGAAVAGALWWSGLAVRRYAALLVVWLWAVPYLPWLPDRWPLLLVLAGPLRWMLLGLAAASLVPASWFGAVTSRLSRLTRASVFVISLVVFAACGLSAAHVHGLVGDEPHYLVISESLLKDQDLQIENNHQRKDYASFFGGVLHPDFMQRGTNGEIYSIHAPGLPAISLPAYAVFGYRGVIVFVALLAALTALAIFDLAMTLAGRPAAIFTWVVTCATAPFIPYAWSIFPEMPGAWIVAYGARWLWERESRPARTWMLRSAAFGLLPWVHTKFVIFAVVFGLALALHLLRRPKALLAFAIPATLSAVAWLYSFYAIYGVWNPEAPYGAYATEFVRMQFVFHGLVGILFDQKFGLLFYSPIYLAAPLGCWWLLKDRASRFPALVLLIAVVAYVGSTARLWMFWGGASAPARFLVPIVPCLAPMVALSVARARHPLWRGCISLWAAIGVGIAILSVIEPSRLILYSVPHGRARILEMLQAGSPLALSVPTFTDPDWAQFLPSLGWWLVLAVLSTGIVVLVARRVALTAWRTTALVVGLFALGGAVLTSHPEASVRRETAQRGALELLERFDGPRHRVANYRTLALASPEAMRLLTTVSMTPENPVPEDGTLLGPLTVAPGRYEARIWFGGSGQHRGEVSVGALGQATFATVDGVLSNPTTMAFDLPITVGRLIVRSSHADVAAAVSRVEIVPVSVVPASERDPSPVYAVESLPARPGALIAYVDEWSYPEHGTFWTRGTARARILVAPAGAANMTMFVSAGPNTSRVTWRIGLDAPQTVTVPAGEEISLVVPLVTTATLVAIELQSSTEFRPGEVDVASTDMRRLGCRVRIEFE